MLGDQQCRRATGCPGPDATFRVHKTGGVGGDEARYDVRELLADHVVRGVAGDKVRQRFRECEAHQGGDDDRQDTAEDGRLESPVCSAASAGTIRLEAVHPYGTPVYTIAKAGEPVGPGRIRRTGG